MTFSFSLALSSDESRASNCESDVVFQTNEMMDAVERIRKPMGNEDQKGLTQTS